MSRKFSERFEQTFGLSLSEDLVDWFDSDIRSEFHREHSGEFDLPVDPDALLDPSTCTVWGGQMLPDTLPILGNGFGDVLALRVGSGGSVTEVIKWSHETGNWRPFGNTLPEAVLCDLTLSQCAGEPHESCTRFPDGNAERWAASWVRRTTAPALEWKLPSGEPRREGMAQLVDAGICEIVALAQSCSASLESQFRKHVRRIGGGAIAEELGVSWSDFSAWLFDPETIPDVYRARLARILGVPEEGLLDQDWVEASALARRARELRPDLAWPHAIVGWEAERKGDVRSAIDAYFAGLRSLGSSCDDVARLNDSFISQRLQALRGALPAQVASDPHFQAACSPVAGIQDPLRDFWVKAARAAEARGDHASAYRHYYHAGWDRYMTNDMEEVLVGLQRSAAAAGHTARHRVAGLHLASLRALGAL